MGEDQCFCCFNTVNDARGSENISDNQMLLVWFHLKLLQNLNNRSHKKSHIFFMKNVLFITFAF